MDLQELQRNWDMFGRTDPLWAVLTDPAKRGNRWSLSEFFATGDRDIDALLGHLESLELVVVKGRALDFGCGVGRLTQALARHFTAVIGVDIAPSMLEQARALNRYGARCEYLLNTRDDLQLLGSGSFDLVYSNITLQHMEPRYAHGYIAEFVRLLAPGGVLAFQLPTKRVRRRLRGAIRRLLLCIGPLGRWHSAKGSPVMEMYATSTSRIVALLFVPGSSGR